MKSSKSMLRTRGAGLALAAMLVVPAALVAHEGHHHQAMGTVKALHEEHLVLTTTAGEEKTFVLSAATKVVRGESAVTPADIAVGERAVVMYETRDGADQALEVKLREKKS
ncbi:MAG: hypothetical protein NDJ75_08115 [Thermoanaerobaculia bacterium]|nr:hypothetical protein [Thermoanaerobaculia bacterium]